MSARSSAATARQCGTLCAVALLGACAVGPRFHRPATPAVTHYTPGSDPAQTAAAEGVAQSLQVGAAVRADWWTLFHSKALNDLIEQSLKKNHDLKAAQDTRDQADVATCSKNDKVVKAVVADVNYGDDSALYERMGYVRKSVRASGLTRKTKAAAAKTPKA